MELTLFELLLFTAIIMTILSFIFFFTKVRKFSVKDKNIRVRNILCASIISGTASGLFVGIILAIQLPTYIYIKQNQEHYTRYVFNTDILTEFGRIFVVNNSDENIYLCAMEYGDKSLDDDERVIGIPVGSKIEAVDGVYGYFEGFPTTITKRANPFKRNVVLWHIIK